jgi:hypothetical protein
MVWENNMEHLNVFEKVAQNFRQFKQATVDFAGDEAVGTDNELLHQFYTSPAEYVPNVIKNYDDLCELADTLRDDFEINAPPCTEEEFEEWKAEYHREENAQVIQLQDNEVRMEQAALEEEEIERRREAGIDMPPKP